MLAIPTDATREIATPATRGVIPVIRPFNAPVMGHVQSAPHGIIKIRFLGARGIGLEKSPIKVEGCGDSSSLGRIGRRGGLRRGGGQQHDDYNELSKTHDNFLH